MQKEISYSRISRILRKQGLEFSKNEFWNLKKQESQRQFIKVEELIMLFWYLKKNDFRIRILEEYVFGENG